MESVKIAQLKNRLSHYLRMVRRGESVLVSDRDVVIARIEPVGSATQIRDSDASWLDALERRGTLRRRRGHLDDDWLKRRPHTNGDVVAALLQERDEGR